MKTIKQIADEIGVSKQAVYDKIKKEPLSSDLKEFALKIDNTLHYTLDGENLIKSAFNKNQQSSVSSKATDNNSQELIDSLKDTISILQKELEVKNRQIEELTATVKILSESINAAQHNALAETIIDTKSIAAASDEREGENKKRGFWRFWKK